MSYFKKNSDEETVDSADDEAQYERAEAATKARRRQRALTKISQQYDLDGDGVLDEIEQAMRDRDVDGDGQLSNEEIYGIVQDQLRAKKSAGFMRKAIAVLIGFVVLLALSNLGTSLAAAFLAKDLKADEGKQYADDVPAMRIASTGEVAAAQTTADTYEAAEMSDEEYDERRRLVLRDMDEDPHSHAHRRLKAGDCDRDDIMDACSRNRISFDTQTFRDEEFAEIQDKCQKKKNVNIRRKWGNDQKSDCLCDKGTSVVVIYKDDKNGNGKKGNKNKNKNKNKEKNKNKVVKVGNKKNKGNNGKDAIKGRNREVIIEREDGRKLHVECDGRGKCFGGGDILKLGLSDSCRVGKDECGYHQGSRLVCRNDKSVRSRGERGQHHYGSCVRVDVTMTDIVRERSAELGGDCDAGKGRNACGDGMYCKPDDLDRQIAAFGGGDDWRNDFRSGGSGNGGWNGGTWTNQGPSGSITTFDGNGGNFNNGGGARSVPQYRGMGQCVRTVGPGQTCWNDLDCKDGNRCEGLNSRSTGTGCTGVLIEGPSGTIDTRDCSGGGARSAGGICRS